MHVNLYGQVTRTEKEVIDLLYQNPDLNLNFINFDNSIIVEKFNLSAKSCDLNIKINQECLFNIGIEEYDRLNQSHWFIPEEIQKFDIDTWLYKQCQTENAFFRVQQELVQYDKFEMRQILLIAKYLVDEFRKNQIVWGVGRGSSVASYCLFLIGLHKIDSLKYNLDVAEFLK
jgi:DNA polymerase III alpha subunit